MKFAAEHKTYVSTDGSAVHPTHQEGSGPKRQTIGGWGAVIRNGNESEEISGGEENTDNNRMELQAVLEAHERIPPNLPLVIRTDSQLVEEAIEFRISEYRKNGWVKNFGKPVGNADLLRLLGRAMARRTIEVESVVAHSGDPDNERAHQLAYEEAIKIQTEVERRRLEILEGKRKRGNDFLQR